MPQKLRHENGAFNVPHPVAALRHTRGQGLSQLRAKSRLVYDLQLEPATQASITPPACRTSRAEFNGDAAACTARRPGNQHHFVQPGLDAARSPPTRIRPDQNDALSVNTPVV
jgi:hypothetical protein